MQQMQLSLGRKAIFPKNVSKLQNPQVGHAPRHIENLNGHTFGRLTVIGLCGIIASGNTKHPTWLCLCECGNLRTLRPEFAMIVWKYGWVVELDKVLCPNCRADAEEWRSI